MANRVSLEDIARKTGVTRNTVSLVLRNMPGISDETRRTILEAANQMGYVHSGKREKSGLTRNLCLIIPENSRRSTDFFGSVQFGIENEARKNNINTMIYYYNEASCFELPASIQDGIVSGIITLGRISEAVGKEILNCGIPLVSVDHYLEQLKTDCILTDNQSGAFTAVEYLIGCGHRRIGFIGDIYRSPSFYDRYNGYLKAMDLNRLGSGEAYSLKDTSMEDLIAAGTGQAAEVLQSLSGLPDAFFCCNDVEAIATLKALILLGKKVPGDVSLIGFDDIAAANNIIPGLSTIHVEKELMGARAVQRLILRMENKDLPPEKLLLPTLLVERQSVRKEH